MKRPSPRRWLKIKRKLLVKRIAGWRNKRTRARLITDSLTFGMLDRRAFWPQSEIEKAKRGPAYLLRNERDEPIRQVTLEDVIHG
jgi:hypothetical protein